MNLLVLHPDYILLLKVRSPCGNCSTDRQTATFDGSEARSEVDGSNQFTIGILRQIIQTDNSNYIIAIKWSVW